MSLIAAVLLTIVVVGLYMANPTSFFAIGGLVLLIIPLLLALGAVVWGSYDE